MLVALSGAGLWAQAPTTGEPPSTSPDPHFAKASVAASQARPLSLEGKARYFAARMVSPWTLVGPALGAGVAMANADGRLPRDWRQGAEAYGRLYGTGLSSLATFNTTRFLTGALLHQDPRYFRAESTATSARLKHALLFTFVNRNDSGHNVIAIPNFVAAAAAGSVLNLYVPYPYNDARYAVTRSLVVLAWHAASNVRREFTPELHVVRKKLHSP